MTTEVESESEYRAECEVCGREVCDCPRPIAECCVCRVEIYDGDRWLTDAEGDAWCPKCLPGGEA
jgi:hypothetical protein